MTRLPASTIARPPSPLTDETSVLTRRSTPCRRWRSAKDAGDLGAEDANQGEVHGLHDGDVGARAAGGGGDLQADPAAADDHQPTTGVQPRPDEVGVLDRAQVGDGAPLSSAIAR